jgi:hypothetical protein
MSGDANLRLVISVTRCSLVDPCEVAGAIPRSQLTSESASRHPTGTGVHDRPESAFTIDCVTKSTFCAGVLSSTFARGFHDPAAMAADRPARVGEESYCACGDIIRAPVRAPIATSRGPHPACGRTRPRGSGALVAASSVRRELPRAPPETSWEKIAAHLVNQPGIHCERDAQVRHARYPRVP